MVGTLVNVGGHAAASGNSRPRQVALCAGMALEVYVPSGGRADCLSETHAIEVEWAADWYSAVGQSLYYAAETGLEPGIILLCPATSADTHGEGLCRSYLYRLDVALRRWSLPIRVWECFSDNVTLDTCVEPEVGPSKL